MLMDGEAIGSVKMQDTQGNFASGITSVIVECRKGQRVWIQAYDCPFVIYGSDEKDSTFSGELLYTIN